MRWTRQRFARDGIAGRVGERPVSDQLRADERCCSVRRSRVVLTPRRWRQVRGVKSAQPGLDKTYPLSDGGKRARSPGRARRKPLKPLRAGMPGDSGVLVVTRVRSITTSAHEAAGASCVVPANAPCHLCLARWSIPSVTTNADGYGSRPSPGRRKSPHRLPVTSIKTRLHPHTMKSRSDCRRDPGNRPTAACRARPVC